MYVGWFGEMNTIANITAPSTEALVCFSGVSTKTIVVTKSRYAAIVS